MTPLFDVVASLVLVAVIAWGVNTYVTMPDRTGRILNLVLALVVVGVGLWLINNYVPMAGSIKAILNVVVFAFVCVRVLQVTGLWVEVVRMWHRITARHPDVPTSGI